MSRLKSEQTACIRLIKSGKTEIVWKGFRYTVVADGPELCTVRVYHPDLGPEVVRTLTVRYKQ